MSVPLATQVLGQERAAPQRYGPEALPDCQAYTSRVCLASMAFSPQANCTD
jgi:hypothetical protein